MSRSTAPDMPANQTIANKTRTVSVAGKKTQLMQGGEGPPLLYLHSAGGETDWLPFHNELGRRFHIYAPAHPGFAFSDGLDEIDDIHDLAWHYVDFFETAGLEQAPIVGFSLGAWIALELALIRPELVSKLVLVNAAGLYLEGAPMGELFIDDFDDLRQLLFFDPDSPYVEQAMPTSFEDSRILMHLRAREATARVGWNPYLHDPKLPGRLRRISTPTMIIWGRQDKLIPLAHGEYYAEHLPNAELKILEQCGHMAPFEKCAEFVKITTDFMLQ